MERFTDILGQHSASYPATWVTSATCNPISYPNGDAVASSVALPATVNASGEVHGRVCAAGTEYRLPSRSGCASPGPGDLWRPGATLPNPRGRTALWRQGPARHASNRIKTPTSSRHYPFEVAPETKPSRSTLQLRDGRCVSRRCLSSVVRGPRARWSAGQSALFPSPHAIG